LSGGDVLFNAGKSEVDVACVNEALNECVEVEEVLPEAFVIG